MGQHGISPISAKFTFPANAIELDGEWRQLHLARMRDHHKLHRLHVATGLSGDAEIVLDRDQSHYIGTVLRKQPSDELLVFNGRDGEWLAQVSTIARKAATLRLREMTRPQPAEGDLHYCFAPLKTARLDYMIQKAVELGASVLQPVITQHTQNARTTTERMRANAIEAAEQCGALMVADVREPVRLDRLLAGWEPERRLVFCDEAANGGPIESLSAIEEAALAVLVGPEGGFSDAERRQLSALPFVTAISLGPRILRADTAAVAALTLVQATRGDWCR